MVIWISKTTAYYPLTLLNLANQKFRPHKLGLGNYTHIFLLWDNLISLNIELTTLVVYYRESIGDRTE